MSQALKNDNNNIDKSPAEMEVEKSLETIDKGLENYGALPPVDQVRFIERAVELINTVHFPQEKYEEVVIFLGKTGVGKSTLINYLAGRKIKAKWKDTEQSEIVLDMENPIKGIKIGHDHVSSTFFPFPYKDTYNKIVYFDCPGLEDTRGAVREIINAKLIRDVITNTKKVKFVITVTEAGLSDRMHIDELISTINSLQSYAGDFEKFKDGMLLVVTHSYRAGGDGKAFVRNKINDILDKVTLSEYQKNFLEFIRDGQKYQLTFKAPTDEKDINDTEKNKIIDALTQKIQPINNEENYIPEKDIGHESNIDIAKQIAVNKASYTPVLSAKAMMIIQQMANHLNNHITEYVQKELVEKIIEYYKEGIKEIASTSDLSQLKLSIKSTIEILDKLTKYNETQSQEFVQDINELVKKISKQDNSTLTKYVEFLEFFRQINKTIKCEVNKWGSGLKLLKDQIEILDRPPIESFADNNFKVSGILIETSKVEAIIQKTDKNAMKEGIKIYAFNTLVFDSNLEDAKLKSKDIEIVAPRWKVTSNVRINISGKDAVKHDQEKASDGVTPATRGQDDRVDGVNGSNGADGLPGNPGNNGGNFLGIGKEFHGLEKLTINANGGSGSNGQDGGNGSDGTDGLREKNIGSRGGDGGNGGKGGSAGIGGYQGQIRILNNKPEGIDPKVVNAAGSNGIEGKDGLAGKGGEGYEYKVKNNQEIAAELGIMAGTAIVGGVVGKVVGGKGTAGDMVGIGGSIGGAVVAHNINKKVFIEGYIPCPDNAGRPGNNPTEKNNDGRKAPPSPKELHSEMHLFKDYIRSVNNLDHQDFVEELSLIGVTKPEH